jgi:hypothetical protein
VVDAPTPSLQAWDFFYALIDVCAPRLAVALTIAGWWTGRNRRTGRHVILFGVLHAGKTMLALVGRCDRDRCKSVLAAMDERRLLMPLGLDKIREDGFLTQGFARLKPMQTVH